MFLPITDGLWLFFFNIFLVTNDMMLHVYNFKLTKKYFDKIIFLKNSPVQPLSEEGRVGHQDSSCEIANLFVETQRRCSCSTQ
jgi:hypothetical protein